MIDCGLAAEKEEQHRLRLALKVLSDTEKQLRVATDRATWLTAALLQFAPDRSFFPSEVNTSAAPSPVASQSARAGVNYPVYNNPPSEPEEAILAPVVQEAGETIELYGESRKHPTAEEVINVSTLSEQKLEEAWAGEPHQQVVLDDVGEDSEAHHAGELGVEFQVFQGEALGELWKRVVWEVTPRNLKNLLQTHGRLVAAGVAVGKHEILNVCLRRICLITVCQNSVLRGLEELSDLAFEFQMAHARLWN